MPAIEVRDLAVSFGPVQAVKNISFEVNAGEIVALLGPNGAGKTTTIETTEGFRRPTEGSVRVLGFDPVIDHAKLIPSVGVMLQGVGTYPQLPPLRAIRLFASYYDNPRDPDELLTATGLTQVMRTPAKRLSGGERQRLALALALVGRPSVIFLDEPTAGIDPSGRIAVRSIISNLRDDGVAIILTTHELEEAERLADRVVIIANGSVVAKGTLDELRQKSHAIHLTTTQPIDHINLSEVLNLTVQHHDRATYLVETTDIAAPLARLASWLVEHNHEVVQLRTGGSSLEEIFFATTGSPVTDTDLGISRERRSRRSRQRPTP
jgi:ABC-2 type transport system ATP-binding protein